MVGPARRTASDCGTERSLIVPQPNPSRVHRVPLDSIFYKDLKIRQSPKVSMAGDRGLNPQQKIISAVDRFSLRYRFAPLFADGLGEPPPNQP